jgi:cytochrome c biogenesis protein CcdA
MDSLHNTHSNAGAGFTIISILCGVFASILHDIEVWVRIGAGTIAIFSGFMAIRYYYYATKKMKK